MLDEAAHVTSDVRASAKQLAKAPIGLLEVGIRGATNLLSVKTKDGVHVALWMLTWWPSLGPSPDQQDIPRRTAMRIVTASLARSRATFGTRSGSFHVGCGAMSTSSVPHRVHVRRLDPSVEISQSARDSPTLML
ncbi:hypothetical protein PTKIN_Ptkin06aG0148800 [Pterospermum kingtungense]